MAKKKAQPPDPSPIRPILKGKHLKTLRAVFARPTPANIAWNDLVSLMQAAGAIVETSGGSQHAFILGDRLIVLHRPHPGNEVNKFAVKDARDFLASVGVRP